MLKKILSPIIYAAFLALSIFLILAFMMALYEAEISSLAIYVSAMGLFTLFSSTLLFWFSSKLITRLEKLHKPKIADHIRQASTCYLLIVYILFQSLKAQYDGFGFLHVFIPIVVMALLISIWAIFVNAIFLYRAP